MSKRFTAVDMKYIAIAVEDSGLDSNDCRNLASDALMQAAVTEVKFLNTLQALRECASVLDGMTAHSWDSGSPFDFRVKEAYRMAIKTLDEATP